MQKVSIKFLNILLNILFLYPRKILNIQSMKKYVSKDDVEKGLVDPTKPLNQQKEYLQKIEKEDREKNPNKEKQKPEYQYKRKQRPNKQKYNWNRRDVVESTPVPQAPKKQVAKPDKAKFMSQLDAFKKQIDDLNKKKSELIHELGSTIRNKSDNKKTSNTIKSKYSSVLTEKHNIRKSLQDNIQRLKEKREEIEKQQKQVNSKKHSLLKSDNFEDCSTQQLQKRLQKLETKLTTADLNKKQQNLINVKIGQIKRAMQKSRPQIQHEADIAKLSDQNQILSGNWTRIKNEINQKYAELKIIKDQITAINEDRSKEKVEPDDSRTIQQIKADYEKRIQGVIEQKDKVKAKIDKLRQKFDKDQDDYEDYFDLISYIKMVNEQKLKIKKWRQEEERRKKEKQQQQKERQRKNQEYQKKKEERIQREEQRKKAALERRQKLQKQREQFINRNPHHEKIQTCQSLIDYCEALKPQNAAKKLQRRQEKVVQPILELQGGNKQWQNQLKKGAQIIAPKKLREQEEPLSSKKVVKEKKKKQTTQTTTSAFTHHIQTARMFEQVNLLPPLTVAELDQTIKQINERIALFNKPSEEQISAYKARAEKQFDEKYDLSVQDNQDRHDRRDRHDRQDRHGERGERGGRHQNYRAKNENDGEHKQHNQNNQDQEDKQERKQKPKNKRSNKDQVVASEKDFPGLN